MPEETPAVSTTVVEQTGAQIGRNLESLFGAVGTEQIFTTLERNDERAVIGASVVERAGGFGMGAGEGVDQAGESGGGGGGGGGGWGQARPVAVIEVTTGGVKIWPVIDYTKLGLAAVAVLVAIWKARR